jgi:hypothetical protein
LNGGETRHSLADISINILTVQQNFNPTTENVFRLDRNCIR